MIAPQDIAFWVFIGGIVGTGIAAWTADHQLLFWNKQRRWGPQAKALRRAKHSVEDMVNTKTRIREEERQKWAASFETLAGHTWRETKKAVAPKRADAFVDFDALDDAAEKFRTFAGAVFAADGTRVNHPPRQGLAPRPAASHIVQGGRHAGLTVVTGNGTDVLLSKGGEVLKTYDRGHYTTCPYECDCPQWARRRG